MVAWGRCQRAVVLALLGCLALTAPTSAMGRGRRGKNVPEEFCVTNVNNESNEADQQDVCVLSKEGNAFFVCRLASSNTIPKATFQEEDEDHEDSHSHSHSNQMEVQRAVPGARAVRTHDHARPPHRMRDCMVLQLREFKEIKADDSEDAERKAPRIKLDASSRTVSDVTVGSIDALKVTMTTDLKTKTGNTKYATLTASVYLFKASGTVTWGSEDTTVEKGSFKTEVDVEYVTAATNKEAQIVWDIFPRTGRTATATKSNTGKRTKIDMEGKEDIVAFGEYKRVKQGQTDVTTADATATVDVGDRSSLLTVKFPLKDGETFIKKFSYDPVATVKADAKTTAQADRRGEGNPDRFCAEDVNGESDPTKKQDVCVVTKEGNSFFICRINRKNPIPDPELEEESEDSTDGKLQVQASHSKAKKPKKAKPMRDCMSVQLKEYVEYSDDGTTVARKVENVKFSAAEGAIATDTTIGSIAATKIELTSDLVADGATDKFATITFRMWIMKAAGTITWGSEDVAVTAGTVKTESEVVYTSKTTNMVADLKWRIVPRKGRKDKTPQRKNKSGKKQVAIEIGTEEKLTVFGQFKQKVGSTETLEDVQLPAADLKFKKGEAMVTTRFSLKKGSDGIDSFIYDPVVEVASDSETDNNTDEVSLEGRGQDTPDKICIENVNGETDKEKMQDVCVLSKSGRNFFVCRLLRKNRLPKPEEEAEASAHRGMSAQMAGGPPKPKGMRDCMAIQLRGYKELDAAGAPVADRAVPRLTLSATSSSVSQENIPGDTIDVAATKVNIQGELKVGSAAKFADFTFTLYMIREDGTIKWNSQTAAVKKGSFKTAGKITYVADATNDHAELEFAIVPRGGRKQKAQKTNAPAGGKLTKVSVGANGEEEFELFTEIKTATTAGGTTSFITMPDPEFTATDKEAVLKMKMPVKGKREIIFDPTATVKADENTVKSDEAEDSNTSDVPLAPGTPQPQPAPTPPAPKAPASPAAEPAPVGDSAGNMAAPVLSLCLCLLASLALFF